MNVNVPTELSLRVRMRASSGRRIALFPGAFRPPHKAHFEAVRDLIARPNIDEVIIVITNRCRHVPGTTKVLDTDVAVQIWAIYLQGLPKVRVEVAPGSAVQHVLSYIERVSFDDHLLFCIGESDLNKGDRRFRNIQTLAEERGVSVNVIPAPTGKLLVRATAVRSAIAQGSQGRAQFLVVLPDHLNKDQCEVVWQICQQGLQDLAVVGCSKVREIFKANQLGEIISIEPARAGKLDVVFRVSLSDGVNLFVKYANDAVEDARFGDPLGPKPRTRLSAERRAIKWLRNNNQFDIELPEVVYFSKKTRTLVLSEVCAGGQSLADCMRGGKFDIEYVAQAVQFLASCHRAQQPTTPFWHDADSDKNHWETILGVRTRSIANTDVSTESKLALEVLEKASRAAARNCFVNLNFTPANILVGRDRIGIIDLELSCSFGDPACDLGYFLGKCLVPGLADKRNELVVRAIEYALDAYRIGVGDDWDEMQSRVTAFAGAAILATLSDDQAGELTPEVRRSLVATAEKLLGTVYQKNCNAGSALKDAMIPLH